MSNIKDFTLPKISDNVDESLVVMWYAEEGETIKEGENLLEVQTEKSNTEIQSPLSGILKKILVKRGDTAKVGETIAKIEIDQV